MSSNARQKGIAALLASIIERQYKGRMMRMFVQRDGLEFEGHRYKSLTSIAKEVSGTHCNGFLFFHHGRKA